MFILLKGPKCCVSRTLEGSPRYTVQFAQVHLVSLIMPIVGVLSSPQTLFGLIFAAGYTFGYVINFV